MGLLSGEVALLTGSSRGIGSVIARRFGEEGAAVAVHGRDHAATDRVAREIREWGGRAIAVVGDLTDPSVASEIVEASEERLGALTVLVANAGGNPTPPGLIEEMTLNQWQSAVDQNLTSCFVTIAATLPGMKGRGRGSIVTMSSAASRHPTVEVPAAYAAAKAGIEVLTRLVALQAGPSNVRANCLAPGTILTERTSRQIPIETQDRLAASLPLQRLGNADDVANAAIYLASDKSSWVSGTILDITGGSVLA